MKYHGEDEIPEDLLRDLGRTPIMPESEINDYARTHGSEIPSRHELDVLVCFAHGMTYRMAAETLGVGEQTVQHWMKHARAKLRAKNKTHAVAEAIRRGLI